MNTMTAGATTDGSAAARVSGVAARARLVRGVLIALGAAIALFVITFALAWFDGARLMNSYLADADRAYDEGKFLAALTGGESFDGATNRYVTQGGYMQALGVWNHPYAWPRPAEVARAEQRIDEILEQRLTIAEAEGFVQANVGKSNPYLGIVYLRLGELYEADGDERSATDIYEEIPQLFPNDNELLERARANLARLEAE